MPSIKIDTGFINKNWRIFIVILIALVLVIALFLYFLWQPKAGSFQPQTNEDSELLRIIKKDVPSFSFIEKKEPYEGGILVEGKIVQGMMQPAVVFVKDNKVQMLPEKYIRDLVNSKKDNKEDKIESVDYYSQYSFGAKDQSGEDIMCKDIFIATVKLASPIKSESAMYPEDIQYQIFVINKYGQLQFKFLSGQPLREINSGQE